MGLSFAVMLTGIGLLFLARQRPVDRDSSNDGWWWLKFIGQWLLISGIALWLVWAVILLIHWLV